MDSTKLDVDNQPLNLKFNARRNKSKALNSLLGIVNGIVCDSKLNDIEISFLQAWTDAQEDKTGDIIDIYYAIEHILEDGIITKEEREDLTLQLNDCLEYNTFSLGDDDCINRFIGFIEGISVDDVVTEIEFKKLCDVIEKMYHLVYRFPINFVKKQIDNILEDGIVEPKELKELCETLKKITGVNFTKDGDAIGSATSIFNEDVGNLTGLRLCLTGKFLSGTRKKIEDKLSQKGIATVSSVLNSTDVLVIGELSSRDWIHSKSGRKIEKALDMRKRGHRIVITSERVLFEKGVL